MSLKRSSDTQPAFKKQAKKDDGKKHTLDSDEEDETENEERYNILDENDIEGEEEGTARQDGETRLTAFNMQEEMEMGHFDKEGHFIWNNEKEVRDNWLDNIDWHRVQDKDKTGNPYALDEKGIADESESDTEAPTDFNEIDVYKKIIKYLNPKESINKALRRLAGDASKLSSVERLKRKKAGTLVTNPQVGELTELADQLLTQLGNMDIYEETFEVIRLKLDYHEKKNKSKAKIVEAELDMYAEDFDTQEKEKLGDAPEKADPSGSDLELPESKELMWEFKWEQHKDKIEGPFKTEQMNIWSNEGYFKKGVWVRKCGATDDNFYSSNRIDFELYL